MYFEAIFNPSEKVNYKPEVLDLEGKTIGVQEGGVIRSGPFKGQTGYYIANSSFGWLPERDLADIKPISFIQWQQLYKRLQLSA